MAKHTYFITGTDTGVGKTIVSAAILEAAKSAGKRTLAMKPIASGCDQTPEGLRNEDALMLQAAITEKLPYDTINPIALKPAIAPHVAAGAAIILVDPELEAQAGAVAVTAEGLPLVHGLARVLNDVSLVHAAILRELTTRPHRTTGSTAPVLQ